MPFRRHLTWSNATYLIALLVMSWVTSGMVLPLLLTPLMVLVADPSNALLGLLFVVLHGVVPWGPLVARAWITWRRGQGLAPATWCGWERTTVQWSAGFIALVVVITLVVGTLAPTGSMSGVPAGMAMIPALIATTIAMVRVEVRDWIAYRRERGAGLPPAVAG